jgi:hypothetical protein
LLDAAASETAGADRLVAALGMCLIADGLPIAGGALPLSGAVGGSDVKMRSTSRRFDL